MKRFITPILLCALLVACGRSSGTSGAAGPSAELPVHAPAGDPATLPKINADPDKMIALIRERFGDAVARNLRILVTDQGGGKRVSMYGEVPNEEIRQALMKELEARVTDMKSEDFTLDIAGPIRQVFSFDANFHMGDIVVFSPDLSLAVTQAGGVFEVATGRRINRMAFPNQEHDCMAFSPDGRTLAVGFQNAGILLFEMPLGRNPKVLSPIDRNNLSHTAAVCFTSDGKQLVSINNEFGEVVLWDLASGRSRTIGTHAAKDAARRAGGRFVLAVSPDNRLIASAGLDEHVVSLWDVSARSRKTLDAEYLSPQAITFSHDGKTLAVARSTGDKDRGTLLYDIASGKSTIFSHGQDDLIASIAFSPDDHTLAVDYENQGVVLFDVPAHKEWMTIDQAKASSGRGLAFSPDGALLATSCDAIAPPAIRLWDVSRRPGGGKPPHLPATLQVTAVQDDAFTAGMERAIRGTFDPRNVIELHATLQPDGSLTLRGKVSDDAVKSTAQRTAEVFHLAQDSGRRPLIKINNQLEVTGQLGPDTRPQEF